MTGVENVKGKEMGRYRYLQDTGFGSGIESVKNVELAEGEVPSCVLL